MGLLSVKVEVVYAWELVATIPTKVRALTQYYVLPIALVTILAPILFGCTWKVSARSEGGMFGLPVTS